MEQPQKRTILDLTNNLHETCIFRLIYFAEIESNDKLNNFFSEYPRNNFFEQVTGLLLVYPTTILHFVEADEETIYSTCLDLITTEENGIGVCRCLPVHVSTTGRLFPRWYNRKINKSFGRTGVNELNDMMKIKKFYFHIVDEFYKFYFSLRGNSSTPVSKRRFKKELMAKLDSLSENTLLPPENSIYQLLKSSRGFELSLITEKYWNGDNTKEEIIWPIPEIQEPSIFT